MDAVWQFILALTLAFGSGEKPKLPGDKPPVVITNSDPPIDKDHPTKP